jgi:invasion protein IalB
MIEPATLGRPPQGVRGDVALNRQFMDSAGRMVHVPHEFETTSIQSSETVIMKLVRIVAAAIFMTASAFGADAADKDTAAPPPVSAEPQNTSATYGDWILNCSKAPDGMAVQRVCEIVQSFQVQGQQGVFARLAIGRVSPKDPLHITLVMQPDVSFPSNVKLAVDDKDTQPVELIWHKCLGAAGCFADADFKDDAMKRWKAQTGMGRLQFKDGMGRDLTISFSFRGLPQALDGLAKS